MTAHSFPPNKRNRRAEAKNVARLVAIDSRIAEIDKQLAKDFPDYAAISNPQPLSVKEVQALLAADEALVLFLTTSSFNPAPEETFIWLVTKTTNRWARSPLGTEVLKGEVKALRCGLDASNWSNPMSKDDDAVAVKKQKATQRVRRNACIRLTSRSVSDRDLPPFDATRAHAVYKSLFGELDHLIRDKRLLIVPSGALTALPFQALVTEKPFDAVPSDPEGYAKVSWLGQRNALTVLPTVASLKALRAHAKVSKAVDKLIGFGNPLLTGPFGDDKSAWAKQSCPKLGLATRARKAVAALSQQIASFFRGGLANVEDVRRQSPLPETTDELCAVARAVGIDPPDTALHLGARATEGQVKQLSVQGKLARSRIVHFATHGLIAGETARLAKARAEPALILTPPAKASETDDGLLTASEVTALKLDADLVILSACNTASGDTVGGDALSGLARAFFYAGARALLVSHWYVDSQATVTLITNAFKALKDDPGIGRAEAMRRAMSALIKTGGRNAHPANWAPFVVVGEGGAGR